VIVLIGVFFASLGSCMWLDRQFAVTRPREPRPELGRVHARLVHGGIVVYLTRAETLPYDYSYVIVIFALAAAVLNQRWRCFGPFTK
jgi:hypothetical protein